MTKQYFKWLLDSCYPRKGRKLEKDKTYNVSDYPANVVDTWVKTKAAKFVDSADKSKKEKE